MERLTNMNTLFVKKVAYSFLRAFAATMIVTVPGILASPNFDLAKAAGISAVVAALAAGFRAIQALFTTMETP